MSDPVLSMLLAVAAAVAIVGAHSFRSLDLALARDAARPLVAGAVVGIVVVLIDPASVMTFALVAGLLLTAAALYLRLTGSESDPADGMAVGALTGLAAAVPLVIARGDDLVALSACLLSGAAAGYGITFALTHVADAIKQAVADALTGAVAVGAAAVPSFAATARVSERTIAIVAIALIPAAIVASVFQRWPVVKAELQEEATLGVIDAGDVRKTAHPLRRLGRAGWLDPVAHREFVRLATRLAVRKKQQRSRPEEIARLYQLEVLKLRMQLQEAERVEMAMRAQAAVGSSDTMADRNA